MEKILILINEMAPYLLLGFLIAGLMHAFIPQGLYSRYLANGNFRSVALATLFGIPLPLCSCGVIPTAMSLRREGASKGATTAFLIATPQTGVDSIIATYSLMGVPFAIIRPIAALVTALLGGQLVNLTEGRNAEGGKNDNMESTCVTGCCNPRESHSLSLIDKLKEAFRYAFVDMMQDIGKWLVVGLVVAGLITVFVPDSAFEIFKDNSLASMLLVLCIAVPMSLSRVADGRSGLQYGKHPGNQQGVGQKDTHNLSRIYHHRRGGFWADNRPCVASPVVLVQPHSSR